MAATMLQSDIIRKTTSAKKNLAMLYINVYINWVNNPLSILLLMDKHDKAHLRLSEPLERV